MFSDPLNTPFIALVLVLIVMPTAVAVFFGAFAMRHVARSVYHCKRCDRDFTRRAWLGLPRACRHCKARDWNR